MKERAAGNEEAVPKQISETEMARKVASEVTRELFPAPVRYGIVLAVLAGLAYLLYSLAS